MSYYYNPWYWTYPYYSYLSGYYPYFYRSIGYGGCSTCSGRHHHHHKSGASRMSPKAKAVHVFNKHIAKQSMRPSGSLRVGVSNNGVFSTQQSGVTMMLKGDVSMVSKFGSMARAVSADTIQVQLSESLAKNIIEDLMILAILDKKLENGELENLENVSVPDNFDSNYVEKNASPMVPNFEIVNAMNANGLKNNVSHLGGRKLVYNTNRNNSGSNMMYENRLSDPRVMQVTRNGQNMTNMSNAPWGGLQNMNMNGHTMPMTNNYPASPPSAENGIINAGTFQLTL